MVNEQLKGARGRPKLERLVVALKRRAKNVAE